MPGEINTVPLGLLSLLGLKEQGNAPNSLLGQVMPVLDLREFYAAQLIRTATEVVNSTGPGGFTSVGVLQVPQNESWLLVNFSAFRALGAAEAIDMAALIVMQGKGFQVGDFAAGVANEFVSTYVRSPQVLPPGSSMGIFTRSQTGAALPITFQAAYVPLRV